MKQLVLIVIISISLLCTATFAESAENALEAGSVGLGVDVGLASSGFAFSANAMVNLYQGLAIGFEMGLLAGSGEDYADGSVRYLGKMQYVFPAESNVKPFIHIGFGYIQYFGADDYLFLSGYDIGTGWTMEAGFGLYIFSNDHFAWKASLDYLHDDLMMSQGNGPSTDTIMFTVGLEGCIF